MSPRITRRHFLGTCVAGTVTGVIATPANSVGAQPRTNEPASQSPNFEDYSTIEAYGGGFPVYSLGNVTYIYGVSLDIYPDGVMPEDNANPRVKIEPKKSWEIKRNPSEVSIAEPGPRSAWNGSQPMLPTHLIDGDPDTAWSSYGSQVPDARPEWIRIDLPAETMVTAVVLVCSQKFAAAKLWEEGKLTNLQDYNKWAGRALPNQLAIQVSRDTWMRSRPGLSRSTSPAPTPVVATGSLD